MRNPYEELSAKVTAKMLKPGLTIDQQYAILNKYSLDEAGVSLKDDMPGYSKAQVVKKWLSEQTAGKN
jgi:hypothetical protein